MRQLVLLLAFVIAIISLPLLVTRGPFARWLNERVDRGEARRLQDPIYALLRREIQQVGKELEGLPYERLLECDDTIAFRSAVIAGVELRFNTEIVSVAKNGDLHVCIDGNASAPGWKWRGVLPSYNFKKRKDGSVYW